jgi:hypothetical protein
MSAQIIPVQYGGKAKVSDWPPEFNKNVSSDKIADLFYIKMEYGLRPYFMSLNDFNSYNNLNKNSEGKEITDFMP